MREHRFTAGLVLGLAGGWLLALGLPALGDLMQSGREKLERPDVQASRSSEPSVMVIVVGTRGRVASVRKAVSSDRILATSENGFAIQGRRLIAVSLENVGGLLMKAGWEDAPLEILTASRRSRTGGGRTGGGRPGKGPQDTDRSSAQAEAAILADLMNKPTLNYLEAQRVLSLL